MLRSARWALLGAVALSFYATALGLAACGSFDTAGSEPAIDASPSADAPPSVDVSIPDSALADVAVDAPDAAETGSPPCKGSVDCDRFVFVTSDTYTGEDLGGSVAGDGKCTNRAALPGAAAALRGRTFRAWVSDDIDNTQVALRMTHGTRPYHLVDGTVIANDWAQLVSGASLLHAIDCDETGAVVGATYAWTGTTAFGFKTASTCTSWSIGGAVPNGTVGNTSATDSTWTNSGTMSCGTGLRLYCFEQ